MKLNYLKHINKIRKRYLKKPINNLDIKKPDWLNGKENILNEIYDFPLNLLKNSNINYGCILQANTLLFDKSDNRDCPATFITSDSEYINNNPEILYTLAEEIYQYKNTELGFVPQYLKKIVESIQNEHDFSRFKNEIEFDSDNVVTVYIVTIMVIRKHLPTSYLNKKIYPLITNFESSETAMILPHKYWTVEIKKYL
ncbi:MAG: hypothetical protein R3Y13_00410 [bacterium]